MKKLFAFLGLFLAINGFAQVKKSSPGTTNPSGNYHEKVLNQALACGDANTAISALHYILAEKGVQSPYADTLAILYLQQNAFAQSLYWADKRLLASPDNPVLLEVKGLSLERVQQPAEAIAIFEKLFRISRNPFHAYKLMELQYGMKRLMETVTTALAAEKLEYDPQMVMTYALDDKRTARTSLLAGVYNIHGLALYDLDRKAEAKEYFQKAVALDSTFYLARQNLESMRAAEAAK